MIKFLNKYRVLILVLIVTLAAILRFYSLGLNPPSLNWDETSIGYNAYSILKTGKDEYGKFLPIEFRSFDDYKPPVYIYLTVPSVAAFGLNEFAVRFPAALFGVLSVIVFYLLLSKVLQKSNIVMRDAIPLIGAFLLAISPWHLQFSRAAYEGNVGLFFLMLALYLFFVGLSRRGVLVLSVLSFVLSLYSYHSFRLVIPLFIPILFVIFYKELLLQKITTIISAIILILLVMPVYVGFLNPQGSKARLSMVSIFIESNELRDNLEQLEIDKSNNNLVGEVFHNRRLFFAREITRNYFDHFSPNFLFVVGAGSFHHHAKDMGMMYIIESPFLILGLYFLGRRINKRILAMIALLLIAPIPASLTTGTPHGVRSIAMMPTLIFMVSAGIYLFYTWTEKMRSKVSRRMIGIGFLFAFLLNVIYYLNQYYYVTPRVYGYFWQAGNKEVINSLGEIDKNSDKVIVSYVYDQPYIYYLFYNKVDPSWYQKNWDYSGNGIVERMRRVIGKYEFRKIDFNKDSKLQNALLVGSPDEIATDENIVDTIYFPDGRVAYKIYKTDVK